MRLSRPFTAPFADQTQPEAPAPAPEPASAKSASDLVFIVGRDGRLRYVNQALGGRSPDEAAGSNLFEWIADEQHEGLRDALDGVFRLGEPQGLELTRIPRHAPHAWYEVRLNPTLRAGDVVSASVVARDITRHKLAVEELNRRYAGLARRHEEQGAELGQVQAQLAEALAARDADGPLLYRFRALLDAAGEAVFITKAVSGVILDANGTACRWLRRTREDVIGRTAEQLGLEFAIHVPEDQDVTFTETRDTRRPAIVTGGVQRRQDGSTFPVEVAVARHRWGDEDVVLAVARDVKEREQGLHVLRQREAAYHDLFEQSWDGIYLTTRSGQIMAANPAVADLLGYGRDEMPGLDARVLFPNAEDIRRFQEAMAASGVVRGLEVQLRRKDGTIIPALLSASRRYGTDGAIQGHQCILRSGTVSPVGSGPAGPVAPAPTGVPVLVVDEAETSRAETAALLTRASISTVEASGLAQAIELLREHAGMLAAVVFGVEPGERGVDLTVEEFRRIDPAVPIIISSNEDRLILAERLSDLEIAAFVDRPPHPLALVQRIRELAARRDAG